MAFEANLKCDYENCQQRYLADREGWWVVAVKEFIIEIFPLSDVEYHEIICDEMPREYKHACGIDHAVIIAARGMDMINHRKENAPQIGQVTANSVEKYPEKTPH